MHWLRVELSSQFVGRDKGERLLLRQENKNKKNRNRRGREGSPIRVRDHNQGREITAEGVISQPKGLEIRDHDGILFFRYLKALERLCFSLTFKHPPTSSTHKVT